jgi:hypothetical protein
VIRSTLNEVDVEIMCGQTAKVVKSVKSKVNLVRFEADPSRRTSNRYLPRQKLFLESSLAASFCS